MTCNHNVCPGCTEKVWQDALREVRDELREQYEILSTLGAVQSRASTRQYLAWFEEGGMFEVKD